MGGIQLVVIGDFYQLTPVPNKWISDGGEYVFELEIWQTVVPHKFILKEVQRQQEYDLIKAISETARGAVTSDTAAFLNSLKTDTDRDIHLYARKLDVSLYDNFKLQSRPGVVKLYISEEGHNVCLRMRKSVDVPKKLFLKVGAPVILTVNLSKKFMNGLSGVVMRLFDDSVEVYFYSFYDLKETMCISYDHFFQFDNNHKAMQFVVKQIPLISSFAMAIKKSGYDLTKCPCRLSGCICPWTDFSRSKSCPQGYRHHSHQFSRKVVPTSPIQSTRILWLYLYTPRRGYILLSQGNRSKSTRAYRSCPSQFFKFWLW